MCGEHQSIGSCVTCEMGSSPHVRGALRGLIVYRHHCGIIPACAGSTSWRQQRHSQQPDHPRMCGEHHITSIMVQRNWGSSPHVRGALNLANGIMGVLGIIPACAGSTLPLSSPAVRRWDHPRMCGEHDFRNSRSVTMSGSSPHVRGALNPLDGPSVTGGIIPACAGSTPADRPACTAPWDHPRMCGEHALPAFLPCCAPGSSPHVRGAPLGCFDGMALRGIIPACAGSTDSHILL